MLKQDLPYNNLPLLPPSNSLVETVSILKQESKSAVALAELKGYAKTLSNPNILSNAIILKEAQASSEIENVITTQDKLYQALFVKSEKIDSATKEVLRYREALLLGTKIIREKGFLNTNGIVTIQKVLEENNAGIRKQSGTKLVNERTKEVIYIPPDNYETINSLLKNYEDYINSPNDDISPLIKLAIQHYQFESIHPFYDGNGRTGRIINILYLILKKVLEEPILYLSSYIIKNKGNYYQYLQEVRTENNWANLILFILEGIEVTSLETIERIKKINELFSEIQLVVQKKLPRIYSKDLIELLFINPYCKIEFLVSNMGIERKTASRYLKSIEDIGIISSNKIGKELIYINTKLYELLKSY